MKQHLGKTQTKTVPFMDGEVEIKVLTVGQAKLIETETKAMQGLPAEEQDQLALLRSVIRIAVVDAEDLTDEEIDSFPVTELTKLSEAIMGMGSDEGNA
ncbi:hypothetical protein [Planktomarina sp.]|uniref:hypothetical protein n=1 Tax=Planktomarina sp. TaxID=2024851 RepID=UPI00326133FF